MSEPTPCPLCGGIKPAEANEVLIKRGAELSPKSMTEPILICTCQPEPKAGEFPCIVTCKKCGNKFYKEYSTDPYVVCIANGFQERITQLRAQLTAAEAEIEKGKAHIDALFRQVQALKEKGGE